MHFIQSPTEPAEGDGYIEKWGIVLCTGPAFVADENKMARDVMRRRGQ